MGSLLHKVIAGAEAGAPAPLYGADVIVKVRCLNGNATWGFSPSSNGSYTVDWGDGTVETDTYEHHYENAGDYVVQIDGAYSVTFSYDANTYGNGTYVKELLGEGRAFSSAELSAMGGGKSSGAAGSEDFAYVSQEVPSIMLALAAGQPEKGYGYPQHHPMVRFDEDALSAGSAVYAYTALRWLEEHR